jgi:RNA polymerase sigma-70 factor (ECF subfamily)
VTDPNPELGDADEIRLVRTARGDPAASGAAFDTLYRRHVARVYRYCYARTGSRSDAEDLTAETFLAALESLGRYRGRGSFAAWLLSIARHKCADHHRRRYAAHAAGHSESVETADALPDLVTPNPADAAEQSDLLGCIEKALPDLSPGRREALHLRFWAGLSVRETAAVMRRREGAVKMLISRAVADLRKRCLDEP